MTDQADELRMVPLAKIRPWPGNPRKSFPEAVLAELAASILAQGLLQPLLLRPCPAAASPAAGRPPKPKANREQAAAGYELADGERRWRAAHQAGLKVVPAIVRPLSDTAMLEISLISEGQRQDLTFLERAEGYARLVEYLGGSVDKAALALGCSASAVRALLRLRLLPDPAKKAASEGLISESVAALIAGRPSEAMRVKVAEFALQPYDRWGQRSQDGERPSVRQVKEWIREHCMVELKQAPFSKNVEGLAGAPSCQVCPQRTGNARDQYPDGREDLCTEPACYRKKVEAWQEQQAAAAAAAGSTVLPAADSKKLSFYHGDLAFDAAYFDLKDQCWRDMKGKQQRSYKQLLEPHLQPADVVLAFDPDGQLHRLVAKEIALPILKKEHGLDLGRASSGGGSSFHEEQRKAAAKASRAKKAALEALGTVAEVTAQRAGKVAGWTLPLRCLLQDLALGLTEHGSSDACLRVCQRRKLDTSKGVLEAVRAEILGLKEAPEVLGLLAELVAARDTQTWSGTYSSMPNKKTKDWWQALGADLDASFRAVDEAAQARGRAKKLKVPAASGKARAPSEAAAAQKAGKKILKAAEAGGGR